jgi:branched-chain amino acid transport system substrate-binding protein
MKKKAFLSVVLLFALVLVSCAPAAAPAEEAPAAEEAAPAEEVAEEVVEAPVCVEAVCEDMAVAEVPAADVDSACAGDLGCAVIEPGQTIKIGMSSPMTGPYADFGIDAENSGLLAVADACGYAGFDFELVAEDDEGGGEGGAAVANKLTADPTVVGLAGALFSGATAAGIPIYDAAGIPMLSPSATNPPLTSMGSAVFNRLPFTDIAQGAGAAAYMFDTLGFTKVAFLHDGEDYGKGLAEYASAAFVELGGESVSIQGITVGEVDYSPVLTTIAADAPDAIYFGGYNQEGAVLTNQMKTVGLENAVFFGCDGTFGADFLDQTGENGEGTYHATPKEPPATTTKENFDVCYESKYGVAPVVLSPFSYNSYDATTALITAVKAVSVLGEDGNLYVPRNAMVDAIRGLTDYTGISGTYTCDEIGECNAEGPQFWTVTDGEYVTVD